MQVIIIMKEIKMWSRRQSWRDINQVTMMCERGGNAEKLWYMRCKYDVLIRIVKMPTENEKKMKLMQQRVKIKE